MFAKPGMHRDADGNITQLRVRRPDSRRPQWVPPEGMEIDPNDLRWARLLRFGDMVPVAPEAAGAAAPDTAAKA